MTEKEFKKIVGGAKTLRLLPEEKSAIKGRLVLFVRSYPAGNRFFLSRLGQFWLEASKLNLSMRSMVSILLVVMLLTGSASALAEGSLPGSPFYSVKVNINEPVRSLLSLSDDAKADWNMKLAERRLMEAERLASSGNLSFQNRVELETRFNLASDDFKNNIDKIKNESKQERVLELSSDFEATLKAHRDILGQLSFAEPKARIEIDDLLEDVESRAELVMGIRIASEVLMTMNPDSGFAVAAEGKLKAVENKVEEATRFLSANRASFDAEAYKESEAKLDEARLKISEGRLDLENGKYKESFSKFQEAMRTAQGAKLLTSSAAELKFKIEGNKLELEIENRETTPTSPPVKIEDEDDDGKSDSESGSRNRLESNL